MELYPDIKTNWKKDFASISVYNDSDFAHARIYKFCKV